MTKFEPYRIANFKLLKCTKIRSSTLCKARIKHQLIYIIEILKNKAHKDSLMGVKSMRYLWHNKYKKLAIR